MKRILYFLLGLILICSCSGEKKEEAKVILRPVKYGKVSYSTGQGDFTFSGVAQSEKQANLSFRVAGTVGTMRVKLGERVRKGQLIATIDPIDYTIQVEQAAASQKGSEASLISAEAQIKSAEVQLITSQATFQRVEKLYENNSVPLSEFEQAKASYQTAKSQHEAAKASYEASKTQVTSTQKQVQAAKNQVNYTRLLAPFSGVVTAVLVEANELVGSGMPVAVLSSESKPEVNVGIPENFISKIKKGQKAKIRFSVLADQVFEGIVQEVSYAAGSSPTYPAILEIKKPSKEIRPGMAATVNFNFQEGKGEAKNYLICPVKAIGEDEKGNFAFVLHAGQADSYSVQRRNISVGQLLPNGFEIKEGLKEGELVATAGLRSLLDGMQVKLMEN